jgi:hypothetical protein
LAQLTIPANIPSVTGGTDSDVFEGVTRLERVELVVPMSSRRSPCARVINAAPAGRLFGRCAIKDDPPEEAWD